MVADELVQDVVARPVSSPDPDDVVEPAAGDDLRRVGVKPGRRGF